MKRTLRKHRRLSQKNQISIPVLFLKKLRIAPREMVTLSETKDGILIRPMTDPLDRAQGFLKDDRRHGETAQSVKDDLRRDERKQEKRKFSR